MQKIMLITGWGMGTAVLQPLKQALEQQGFQVDLLDVFTAQNPDIFAAYVQRAQNADVLIGWSLGGELAILLADAIYQQTGEAKPLITLATNPCFVAHSHWHSAMPQETFQAFKESFQRLPAQTLKRFVGLVAMGSETAKAQLKVLQQQLEQPEQDQLQAGLELLEQLNLLEKLQQYPGPQLHLYAGKDALVPASIVQKMQQLPAKNLQVKLLKHAAHSFPCFEVEWTVQQIQHFCQELQKN